MKSLVSARRPRQKPGQSSDASCGSGKRFSWLEAGLLDELNSSGPLR